MIHSPKSHTKKIIYKSRNLFSVSRIFFIFIYKMYKVNNRKLLNRPVQARRPMSTHVRKGGLSKLLMGGLLISAAGMAYYQKLQKNGK